MNIWFTNEHEKTTNLNELNELRQREFVSVCTSSLFILSYQGTEFTERRVFFLCFPLRTLWFFKFDLSQLPGAPPLLLYLLKPRRASTRLIPGASQQT